MYRKPHEMKNALDMIVDVETAKRRQMELLPVFADSYHLGTPDRMAKFRDCGTYVGFDEEFESIAEANFCRQRFCPCCQRRKSLRTFSQFMQIAEKLNGCSFLHLVLTVPNCTEYDLSATIAKLYAASSKFFKLPEVKKAFRGAARCLEVSYNKKRNDYHPHLHCLVAVLPSYFTSRDYLSRERLQRLHTASIITTHGKENKCSPKRIAELAAQLEVKELLQVWVTKCEGAEGFAEVAKYAVKPVDVDGRRAAHVYDVLFEALHGRRLVQTYGNIRDTARMLNFDFDNDDIVSGGNAVHIYRFDFEGARYQQIK